jgi:histidine triad (HIT) family protein
MAKSIFSQIIDREIPADIVFESEDIIVFKDIFPSAPVHLLICPKKEIAAFSEIVPADWPLVTKALEIAQKLAKELQLNAGYRIVTNSGKDAGQQVMHLHFHLIGGQKLGPIA